MANERRDAKHRKLGANEYQRKDGRYEYRYTDAKGVKRSVYSWTLTESDRPPQGKPLGKCLKVLEKEIQQDIFDKVDSFSGKKLTLNDCFDRYAANKKGWKKSTRENYTYYYNHTIRNDLGQKKIADINYSDIQRLYYGLYDDMDFLPSTIEIINAVLHPVFRVAIRDGYIRTNPTDGVLAELKKTIGWQKTKKEALTEEQQAAFMEYVQTNRKYQHWYPLFLFMLGTGCRVGEAVGMRWEDLDLVNGYVYVNHTVMKRRDETKHYRFHADTPKTDNSVRQIPMLEPVKNALIKEYQRQKQHGFTKGAIDGYTNFAFQNRQCEVVSPANVNTILKSIVAHYNKAEQARAEAENREPQLLPHISAHILRHTFCTRLCENESNLKLIQETMGHATIKITMDVYYTVTQKKQTKSFAALEGKLLPATA